MCDCRKQANKDISAAIGKEGHIVNYDMLSGKTYSTFEYQDGKRTKKQLILHAYCPFCGQRHEEKAGVE